MKNFTKLFQVSALVLLFSVITTQITAQQMPARQSTGQSGIEATEFIVPGTASTTMYTPPVTDVPAAVLFDNGAVFNSVGTGAGGANESIIVAPISTFGFGCQYAFGYSVADDFIVPAGSTWAVSSIEFFAYQTNSTTASTINGLAVQIWNGKPGEAGSAVVWGDFVTNVLASTTFSNIYRVTTSGNIARPIMQVVANTTGLSLPAGTYWVEWALTGTLASGPWAPPVVAATPETGNAIQSLDEGATYADLVSGGTYPQGLPFIINGTVEAPIPTLGEWGLILLGLALLGFGTFYILRMKSA
jgi:hypothetical protein